MIENNSIAIALITDKNYVMQVSVVIASIKANQRKNVLYDIFVLTDGLFPNDETKLKSMESEYTKINIINVGTSYKDIPNKQKWSNTVFIKFWIPYVIQNYDKVLYLDADAIINNDINDMYHIDLNNNYAGVVPDITQVLQDELLTELDNYFCAGVILFNTKKIREEYTLEQLIQYYVNNLEKFYSLEQDAFNYMFGHKVLHLHPKYQYIILYDFYLRKIFMKFYGLKNKKEISQENLAILHYVTLTPWKYWNTPYVKIWDKYYKQSPFYKPLKRKFYNPLFNVYRRIRYTYRFLKFNKDLYFNHVLKRIEDKFEI